MQGFISVHSLKFKTTDAPNIAMSFYAILLKDQKLLALKKNWIKNPILNANTSVFFSPNDQDNPNFELKTSYFFKSNVVALYDGYVLKMFGKYSCLLAYTHLYGDFKQFRFCVYKFCLDDANQAANYILSRKNRPLRATNYFSTDKKEYIKWKTKGIVEEIDLNSSDDEV